MNVLLIPGEGVAVQLEQMARTAAPREVVGLLTADGRVIMLPNRSSNPESNFVTEKRDIISAIRMHELEDIDELAIWHSHPAGGVGPSRIDMQQRIPFLDHFVVTLTETEAVFTWY